MRRESFLISGNVSCNASSARTLPSAPFRGLPLSALLCSVNCKFSAKSLFPRSSRAFRSFPRRSPASYNWGGRDTLLDIKFPWQTAARVRRIHSFCIIRGSWIVIRVHYRNVKRITRVKPLLYLVSITIKTLREGTFRGLIFRNKLCRLFVNNHMDNAIRTIL